MGTSSEHDGNFKKDFRSYSNEYKWEKGEKNSIPLLFTFTMHAGVRDQAVETKMISDLS
jgi:hypothetical protein